MDPIRGDVASPEYLEQIERGAVERNSAGGSCKVNTRNDPNAAIALTSPR